MQLLLVKISWVNVNAETKFTVHNFKQPSAEQDNRIHRLTLRQVSLAKLQMTIICHKLKGT